MLICSPVDEHLACLQFGAVTNETAMNICVHSLYEHKLSFLLINKLQAGRYTFNFIRNCRTVFQRACGIVCCHQQEERANAFMSLPILGSHSF